MSRPMVVIASMLGSPKRDRPNGDHGNGTYVPVGGAVHSIRSGNQHAPMDRIGQTCCHKFDGVGVVATAPHSAGAWSRSIFISALLVRMAGSRVLQRHALGAG